jgi:3-dehydroquinate dehydratase-2
MPLIAVVNGPNLNLLGVREPAVYGGKDWGAVKDELMKRAADSQLELDFFQSNHEGAIIDYIQGTMGRISGMIINPGALTHYSFSLRDALAALDVPIVEVHITNIHAREEWRSYSTVSTVVSGVISGLGTLGYGLALEALSALIADGKE